MKTMKLLFGVHALACSLIALFIPLAAQAQQYDILTTLYSGGTNNIAAATTNSAAAKVIGLAKYDEVAIDVKFKLIGGAGTDTIVFKLDESLDGVNWLANRRNVLCAANGTNAVYYCTNITVGSLGYFRLNVIENPATNAITNLQIRAYGKPRRSG